MENSVVGLLRHELGLKSCYVKNGKSGVVLVKSELQIRMSGIDEMLVAALTCRIKNELFLPFGHHAELTGIAVVAPFWCGWCWKLECVYSHTRRPSGRTGALPV